MKVLRLFARLLRLALIAGLALGAWMIYFVQSPLELKAESQNLALSHGGTLRGIAHQMVDEGVLREPWSFMLLVQATGQSGAVQSGNYQLTRGMTLLDLYEMLISGDAVQNRITFVEGWTFFQMREALNRHEAVRHLSMPMTDEQILQQIGADEKLAEGLFFPDSYYFSNDTSDLDILRRSYQTMQRRLAAAWQEKADGLTYDTPYQALVMASIIEKETARSSERPLIARVFLNRLTLGMRLQTDPTVIYGMGPHFDGNLRRRDLLTDTPYNTYTRFGLPPTPIAMPGMASIKAALHPASGDALYFVGKGDGSHIFSATLSAHNRSVARYQLGKGP